MTGTEAFRRGCGAAARAPGLVLALYGANLLLALPLAIGFLAMMKSAFGSSMAPETLLEGFDATVVHDALAGSGDAFQALVRTAIPTALLGMLVNTAMAGGILNVLLSDQSFSARLFLEGIGKFIGRFMRLWAVMMIIGAALFLFLSVFFGMISGIVIQSESDRTATIGAALGLLVYAPLVLLVMAGDYAKIQIASFDLESVWKAAGRGFLFLLRNPGSAILLQSLLFLLLAVATAIYWGIDAIVGMNSAGTIFLIFCVQQIYMGVRMWIRAATFAGAAALSGARKPHRVIFYGWDDSPAQEPA
jgi:hypothetical protein